MERILRSVMQVGGVPDSTEAHRNWLKLQEYDLEFSVQEDKSIHDYLKKFYDSMSSPPDFVLVKEYFEKQDQIETVERLEEIKKAQFYIQTNYLAIVRAELERQQTKNFAILCRDASAIAEHGRNLDKPVGGKKILKGVNDAVNYVFDKLHKFTEVEGGEKLEGVASEDADDVIEETETIAKTNKYANRNLFGLEPVDAICKGHRSGEYWVHCGFAGELKSTLAMNYMYNNVYVYGKNIFYAILEMPYTQLRRALFVLHSSHGKFVTDWYEKDRKAGRRNPYQGIDYRKVRDGELDDLELQRFKTIAQDFKATVKGKPFIWRPKEDVSIDDIRRKAEMFHNKYGCDGIIIDHLGLAKPRYRSNDTVARINDVVREGRLMALNFGRGKTVPVLALFQLNRQGKLRADKNDGRYDFAAISYANEVEKSADVITYTYLNDQLRSDGKFYLGNLKNRDNPVFNRMVGKIIWQSKRMRHIESGLIDLTNDVILSRSQRIALAASNLQTSDLLS
jgi:replicative DNA helicase